MYFSQTASQEDPNWHMKLFDQALTVQAYCIPYKYSKNRFKESFVIRSQNACGII